MTSQPLSTINPLRGSTLPWSRQEQLQVISTPRGWFFLTKGTPCFILFGRLNSESEAQGPFSETTYFLQVYLEVGLESRDFWTSSWWESIANCIVLTNGYKCSLEYDNRDMRQGFHEPTIFFHGNLLCCLHKTSHRITYRTRSKTTS